MLVLANRKKRESCLSVLYCLRRVLSICPLILCGEIACWIFSWKKPKTYLKSILQLKSERFIISWGHLRRNGRSWARIGAYNICFSGKKSIPEDIILEAEIWDTTQELDKYEWINKKGRFTRWAKWTKRSTQLTLESVFPTLSEREFPYIGMERIGENIVSRSGEGHKCLDYVHIFL